MKPLLFVFIAAAVCAAPSETRPEISAQAWLETYYLDPQPAEVPRAIQRLCREGYFDRDENTAIAVGFLGTLFQQHAAQVDDWLDQLRDLTPRHRRVIAAALWQAGHERGGELLRALGAGTPLQPELERLARTPSQRIMDTSVVSVSSMRLQWGAFLASGDERHIICILEAFGLDQPQLTTTARLALAQIAAAHPRVLQICQAQLARQPEEISRELRAALAHVPAPPRS
jgi:hypothetical protein